MVTGLCLCLLLTLFLAHVQGIDLSGVKSIKQNNKNCKYENCVSPDKKVKRNYTHYNEPNGFESEHTRRFLQEEEVDLDIPITDLTTDARVVLEMVVDPPEGHFSPTALGIFLKCTSETAIVYYTIDGTAPTFNPATTSRLRFDTPYVHMDTPFLAGRYRVIRAVAAEVFPDGFLYRSPEITRNYVVEATERPGSYCFLAPGVDSGGYFTRMAIEVPAAARAQVAGGQEFADFNTSLGIGTYSTQLKLLHLPSIDRELGGFEGAFSANTSFGHYGFVVPYHNRARFFGKLVRVRLADMENITDCMTRIRTEWLDDNGNAVIEGHQDSQSACVTVLHLETIHEDARGFKRGFMGVKYGFLSPAQFDVAIRIYPEDFGIHSTKALDLGDVLIEYGGYSGGFEDGPWACFNPMRSFVGPIGGVRSRLEVDRNHLRAYHNAVVVCVNESAWDKNASADMVGNEVRSFDLGDVQPTLRGFSDAIKVGRFVYLAPFASDVHTYSHKLIRIDLGFTNIIENMDAALAKFGGHIRDIVDVLDLTQKDAGLSGFSGIFNAGKYIYLVPWRNEHLPYNGQRGFGLVPRIDLNIFDAVGIDVIDLPTSIRSQIPSFPDSDLRGFSDGFASGVYGLFVPYFNGIFSGKVARFNALDMNNVQEVDLMVDREVPEVLKGFRGGFVNNWQGTPDDIDELRRRRLARSTISFEQKN